MLIAQQAELAKRIARMKAQQEGGDGGSKEEVKEVDPTSRDVIDLASPRAGKGSKKDDDDDDDGDASESGSDTEKIYDTKSSEALSIFKHCKNHGLDAVKWLGKPKPDVRIFNKRFLPFLQRPYNNEFDARPRKRPTEGFKSSEDKKHFEAMETFWANWENVRRSQLKQSDGKTYKCWRKISANVFTEMVLELCEIIDMPFAQAYRVIKARNIYRRRPLELRYKRLCMRARMRV
jgi:hypothetical protein